MNPFIVGEVYKRTEIHDKYGGQRQSGISTPAKYPFIFLFTGGTGEQYGYKDQPEGNVFLFTGGTGEQYGYKDQPEGNVFLYTGEGQKGNMEFISGNRAIRDSATSGEELHLFKIIKKGYVEYIGPKSYTGYRIKQGYDVEKHSRKLIVFELTSVV